MHNILESCTLLHGNFFERRLNTSGYVLMQSEIIKQSVYFPPVYIFVKNFHGADFKLYLNPEEANTQHLFRLSGIGQMPLHKCRNAICCALRGQGGGACALLCSKNPAARRRQQSVLLWHTTRTFRRCAHYKHDKDIRIVLF